jgi:hypothetical protein
MNIRHPLSAALDGFANLDKLSITSTNVSPDDLLPLLSIMLRLRTLNIGTLRGSHGKRIAFGNASTMTLIDGHLRSLTEIVAKYAHRERQPRGEHETSKRW